MAERPWLVVGLGNPGPEYAANRHNVGSMVLDLLAARAGGRFKAHKARAEVVEARFDGKRVVLAKPRSYMNESGGPVAARARLLQGPTERIVVVHDELDLDYGVLRLKRGGGDNGHNGLRSVTRSLGTPRLPAGPVRDRPSAGPSWTRRSTCSATSRPPSARTSTSSWIAPPTPPRPC